MKVIKKGRLPDNPLLPVWERELSCSGMGNGGMGCGATLLVEGSDLFRTYDSSCGRIGDMFITFECPDCCKLTDVDDKIVPPILRMGLRDREQWQEARKRIGRKGSGTP